VTDKLRSRFAELFGIDLRTLALFRVTLATVVGVDLARRLFIDLRAFYTDWGVLPGESLLQSDAAWRFNLFLINEQSGFAALLLVIGLLASIAMWWGYRTRIAVAVLFIIVVSVLNRNPMVLTGGDNLMVCLLFWSMFLPLNARWSIDAALAPNSPPCNPLHVSWASAGILLQVMSIYFFSAVLKIGDPWWPDGLAVYYTMELERYVTTLGRQLLEFPILMKGLTYFVYFLGWIGPILVFLPIWTRTLRFTVMLMLMLIHLGFILCLEIGHFPYVSLSSLTLLLGGWAWDQMAAWRDRGPAPAMYYDRDCGFCRRQCLLLRCFLVLPQSTIRPAQDDARAGPLLEQHNSWVVIDRDGEAHLKWNALVALLRASLFFGWLHRPLAWSGWRRVGDAVYDAIGRRRSLFGRLTAGLEPTRDVPFESGLLAQSLAGGFLILTLTWNLATAQWLPPQPIFKALTPSFQLLRIDQHWDMSVPFPVRVDGWVVFPGELEDGTEVDVLRPGQPLDFEKPALIARTHENLRWHTYRWRIWEQQFEHHRLYYGRYLCREWNRRAEPGSRLTSFDMVWMQWFTVPPGETGEVIRETGWMHQCLTPESEGADPEHHD